MYHANYNMIGYLPTAECYQCETLEEAKEILISQIKDDLSYEKGIGYVTSRIEELNSEAMQAIDTLYNSNAPLAVTFNGYSYWVLLE